MAGTLDLGNLLVHLRADTIQFNKVLANAETRMRATADKLTSIGRTISMRVTVPLLAAAAAAAKIGISMESAFIGVRKTVEATEIQFAALQKGFENMSLRIPLSIENLYGLGAAAGQLGIQTGSILKFSETMAQLGVTTDISSQEAAMALARFANITQMPQNQFDRLGATIVDLGNTFAAMESEIVEMGLRIAAAGKLAGMTEANIMAISTALSAVGVEAQVGGTSVQKVLIGMVKAVAEGGKELKVFANVAGKTAEDFATIFRKDAAEAFTLFIEGLKRSGDSAFAVLENLGLQDMRLLRSILSLAGADDLLRNAIVRGNKAWEENIALVREAELRFGSTASQLRLFWNYVRLTAASFKDTLMPPVMEFLENYMKPLLTTIKNFNEETKINIVLYGGIAAAIGPVLIATGLLLKGLVFMVATVKTLIAAFVGLGAAIASPLVAIIALAAIAYVLRAAWLQNIDVIKTRMQEWFNSFKEGFDWLIEGPIGETVKFFAKSWLDTFHFVKTNFGQFISDIAGVWGGMKAWMTGGDWAQGFVDQKDKADAALADFNKGIIKGYEVAGITLTAFGEATVEHLEDLMGAVKTQFGKDADDIINLIKSKIQTLQEIPISPHEQLRQMMPLMESGGDSRTIVKQMEDLEVSTEKVVATTMTLADAYRAIRGEMGRMTKDVYDAQLKIIAGLKKEYETAGVGANVLIDWEKEQIEVLKIEYLKSTNSMANGFQAAGMQIKREIKSWGEKVYEFSMTLENSIATGLENSMKDFDNWKDHLLNVFEEVYWAAVRIAFIQPAAQGLAGGFTAAAGSLFGGGTATNEPAATMTKYDSGGIAWSPQVASLAESEPELITPFSQLKNLVGSGNQPIQVHLHNEGTNQTVTKAEAYLLSDQRILDVWTKDAIGRGRGTNRVVRQVAGKL